MILFRRLKWIRVIFLLTVALPVYFDGQAQQDFSFLAPISAVQTGLSCQTRSWQKEQADFETLNSLLDEVNTLKKYKEEWVLNRMLPLAKSQEEIDEIERKYPEIEARIKEKKVYLNGRQYTLLGVALQKIKSYTTQEKPDIRYLGISAMDKNGRKVVLMNEGKKLFYTVSQYPYSMFDGSTIPKKETLSLTGRLLSPENEITIFQYGGEYLDSQFLSVPPKNKKFDFDKIHFTHDSRGGSQNIIDIFNHGLLPNSITGRSDGDNYHNDEVSFWIKRNFVAGYRSTFVDGMYKNEIMTTLLISIEDCKENGLLFEIPESYITGEFNKEELNQTEVIYITEGIGQKTSDEHVESNEVQIQKVDAEVFSALVIDSAFLDDFIGQMDKGLIPAIPLYDEKGNWLNEDYLSERVKRFVYSAKEVNSRWSGDKLEVDMTLFAGDWQLEDIVKDLGLEFFLRYGIEKQGEWEWSGMIEKEDLVPESIQFVERTDGAGYRIKIIFSLPLFKQKSLKFSLQLKTQKGQVLWINNDRQDYTVRKMELKTPRISEFSAVDSSI